MRRTTLLNVVVLAVSALLLAGCSKNKGKLEGTKWSSQPATVKGITLPPGALQLEFSADKKLIYTAGPTRYTGTYKLGMGNNVTFNLDQELAGRKQHTEQIVVSGDTMTMTDSDGTTLNFSRAK